MPEQHIIEYPPKHSVSTYFFALPLLLTITMFFMGNADISAQYSEGANIYKSGDKYGFINEDGKVMVPVIYDKVYDLVNGRTLVKLGKWGMIDKYGAIIIPTVYDNITPFSSGDVIIDSLGKKGIMTDYGRTLCTPTYDDIQVWYTLFLVKLSGKWGMIDRNGEIVLPIMYEGPPVLSMYDVKMKKDNVTYTIDNKGKLIK